MMKKQICILFALLLAIGLMLGAVAETTTKALSFGKTVEGD